MTSNIEFKYNGKVYQAVAGGHCAACAFDTGEYACDTVMDSAQTQTGYRCDEYSWQEKPSSSTETACNKSEPSVPMWTLDEIEQAYNEWDTYDGFSVLARILRKQKQGEDPEYQKYLELKAKFGDWV